MKDINLIGIFIKFYFSCNQIIQFIFYSSLKLILKFTEYSIILLTQFYKKNLSKLPYKQDIKEVNKNSGLFTNILRLSLQSYPKY